MNRRQKERSPNGRSDAGPREIAGCRQTPNAKLWINAAGSLTQVDYAAAK
jgi:hypothetical protein